VTGEPTAFDVVPYGRKIEHACQSRARAAEDGDLDGVLAGLGRY
jgi:hypothetical protein